MDTRSKGLVWILECLKDLDIVVMKDMMPLFVDEQSKDFIMKLAQMDY